MALTSAYSLPGFFPASAVSTLNSFVGIGGGGFCLVFAFAEGWQEQENLPHFPSVSYSSPRAQRPLTLFLWNFPFLVLFSISLCWCLSQYFNLMGRKTPGANSRDDSHKCKWMLSWGKKSALQFPHVAWRRAGNWLGGLALALGPAALGRWVSARGLGWTTRFLHQLYLSFCITFFRASLLLIVVLWCFGQVSVGLQKLSFHVQDCTMLQRRKDKFRPGSLGLLIACITDLWHCT